VHEEGPQHIAQHFDFQIVAICKLEDSRPLIAGYYNHRTAAKSLPSSIIEYVKQSPLTATVFGSVVTSDSAVYGFEDTVHHFKTAIPIDGINNFICVPLQKVSEHSSKGSLFVANKQNMCSKDIEIAHHLAKIISHVIEKNRVFEETRNERDNAVRASEQKNQWVASVSHEVRTPLNVVLGMASLLFETHLNPEQYEYVESVNLSGNILMSIISQLLEYAKLESGKIEKNNEEFDLRSVIEGTVNMMFKLAHAKNLQLGYYISPNLSTVVRSDPVKLQQICFNLLGNAVKFTSNGEAAFICSGVQRLENGKTEWSFEVMDTGPGMDGEQTNRLFQPYTQVGAQKGGGTGLGLYLTKQFVELLDGSISIKSEKGKGTTVSFKIQTDDVPPERQFQESITALKKYSTLLPKVIIYFPVPCIRKVMISSFLRECGFAISFPHNDKEMVNTLDHERHDFLVMGDPSLYEQVRDAIKKSTINNELKMIIVSPTYRANDPENASAVFIQAPYTASRLNDALDVLTGAKIALIHDQNNTENLMIEKLASKRVLIVEDNPLNRELIIKLLHKAGISSVQWRENGIQALELIEREQIDLMLCDILMPVLNGFETAKRIRSIEMQSGRSHMPIIAVTANVLPSDAEQCLQSGMDDFLPKPIKPSSLRELLHKYLVN